MRVAGDDTGKPVSPGRRMSQGSEGFRKSQAALKKSQAGIQEEIRHSVSPFGFIVCLCIRALCASTAPWIGSGSCFMPSSVIGAELSRSHPEGQSIKGR